MWQLGRPRTTLTHRGFGVRVSLVLVAALTATHVHSQGQPKPLSKDNVIRLLKGDVSPVHVADLARKQKIDFQITPEVESELRRAGADDPLINTLRQLAKPALPPAPVQATCEIESTPGGAQVYLDDEFKGTTSNEGRLNISGVMPGTHRLRVSRDGFDEHTEQTDFKAGQDTRYVVKLVALKAASPNLQVSPAPKPVAGSKPTTGSFSVESLNLRSKGDQSYAVRDYAQAVSWYRKGAMLGDDGAVMQLNRLGEKVKP